MIHVPLSSKIEKSISDLLQITTLHTDMLTGINRAVETYNNRYQSLSEKMHIFSQLVVNTLKNELEIEPIDLVDGFNRDFAKIAEKHKAYRL